MTQGGVHAYSCNLLKELPEISACPPPPVFTAYHASPTRPRSRRPLSRPNANGGAHSARGGRCALMCTEDTTANVSSTCYGGGANRERGEDSEGGLSRQPRALSKRSDGERSDGERLEAEDRSRNNGWLERAEETNGVAALRPPATATTGDSRTPETASA